MARERKLLTGGLFQRPAMDTRVRSRTVNGREKVLGHLVGPLGLIMVINTMGALLELFFTEQVPLDAIYGTGTYLSLTVTGKVLGTAMGLVMGWVFQHTASKQGRFRPWGLMGGLVCILTAAGMFFIPGAPEGAGYLGYVAAVYLLYNVVGLTVYNAFSNNIVPLTTRSFAERTSIQYFRKLALTLISGILIGLVLTSVVYYNWLIHNRDAWEQLMLALCVIAVPLLFIEYFYTRERVMEDVAERTGTRDVEVPLGQQVKALLTNKYYVLMLVGTTIAGIVGTMKGGNVTTNFCRWVLGATAENNIQMMYTILTGVPLGLGAIIAYPLAKRMGVRNMSILGYGMVAAGSLVGLLFPNDVLVAYGAGFIRQMGLIADCYVFPALLASVGDMVEYKSGFRPEGLLSASIIALVLGVIQLPFGGAYETILLARGFDASLAVQPAAVQSWVSFTFYGFDLLLGLAWCAILPFMDLEKRLPQVNAQLQERKKQAVLARGEEWVEPEELERREREEQARLDEENRLADLRAKCQRRGLSFEEENEKYLKKQAGKSARAQAKAARKGRE